MSNNWSRKMLLGLAGLLLGLTLGTSACTLEPQVETEAGAEVVQEEDDAVGEEVVIESATPIPEISAVGVTNADGLVIRASRLLDYNFENSNGDVSGEIENMLLDISTGQILFVTIEYGGFLDLGDTHLAMPLNAFSWNADDQLVLNIQEERLENFPSLGRDWPDLSTDIWDDEVNQFWLAQGIDSGVNVDDDSAGQVMYIDDFMDLDISDMGFGEGDIHDVLIDLSQSQSRYVVVDYGNELFDDNLVTIPFSALFGRTVDDELILAENIDWAMLESAPTLERGGFDEADYFGRDFDSEIVGYWEDAGYVVVPESGS